MSFQLEIVPRYWETDQQHVVFNMWYLGYLTQATESFFEHIGHPIPEMIENGAGLQLVQSHIDWVGSLKWGETAMVDVACARVGTTSLTLRFEFAGGGTPVARATGVYVLIATDGTGKREIPAELREGLEGAASATD
jgi:acyl-CoA thioester hydrolase